MKEFESQMAAKKEQKKSKKKIRTPKKGGREGRVAEGIVGASNAVKAGEIYFLVKVSTKIAGYSCQ